MSGCLGHGSVLTVTGLPSAPPHYLARQEVDSRVAAWLATDTARPLALVGQSSAPREIDAKQFFGVGTSTTALAAARAAGGRFADGVVWVRVGPAPSIPRLQARLAQTLGSEDCFARSPCAVQALRRIVRRRHVLLVLDDVHEPEHAAALDIVEAPSRMMLTCHDTDILARVDARPVCVPPFTHDQARLVLSHHADVLIEELDAAEAHALDAIVAHCERLPLMLQMAGALAKEGSFADALQRIERARGQSPHVSARLPSTPAVHVFEAAYQALKKQQRLRYRDLGVLPDDEPVSEPVLAALWQRDLAYVRRFLELLAARSLITRTGDGRFQLHDSQRWYVRARDDDPPSRHDRLLQALSNDAQAELESESDRAISDHMEPCSAYLARRAMHHAIHAHRLHEVRRLLCDTAWLTRVLRDAGPFALAEDIDRVLALSGPDPELDAARAIICTAGNDGAGQPESLAHRIASLLGPHDRE